MGRNLKLIDAMLEVLTSNNASLMEAHYALVFVLADVVRQLSVVEGDGDETATLDATFEFIEAAVEYQNNTPIESAVAH